MTRVPPPNLRVVYRRDAYRSMLPIDLGFIGAVRA